MIGKSTIATVSVFFSKMSVLAVYLDLIKNILEGTNELAVANSSFLLLFSGYWFVFLFMHPYTNLHSAKVPE